MGYRYPDNGVYVSRPRYAASVDLNQQEIIDALKEIGCSVLEVGTPVDLSVGYRKHNFYIEVKRPGQKPRTKAQKDFLRDWRGQVRVCTNAEEAIKLVTEAYK